MRKFLVILLLLNIAPIFAQKLIYDQEFDGTLDQGNFKTQETDDRESYIEDGAFIFKYLDGNNFKFSTEKLDVNNLDSSNFIIEMKIKYDDGPEDQAFGMVLNVNSDASDFYLFSISNNGYYKIQAYYSEKYHDQVAWTKSDIVNEDDWNILRVERTGTIARYYLNGVNIYNDENFYPSGYWSGLFAGAVDQEIAIDYIKFWAWDRKINTIDNPLTNVKKEVISILNSPYDEVSPRIATDGKTIFFTRDNNPVHIGNKNNQDIWYSTLENDKWTEPIIMPKPVNNDGANVLITITPDNNTIYLSNAYDEYGESAGPGMSVSHRTATGWEVPQQVRIENFYNDNQYVSYFMSQNRKILFTAIEQKDTRGGMDICVSKLLDDGSYSSPINLGDKINTFADDFNPFLAPDNKTLYYITAGKEGFGKEDVWTTKRLDDTWLNWSEPKNLGPVINSSGREFAFSLTAKGDEAYMVSYEKLPGSKGQGDIVKVRLSESAKPDPVVLVYGKVLNKKTNEPIEAQIEYFGLKDGKNYGNATSNGQTGEYKIILPQGVNYGFKSTAKGFISISENLDLTNLKEYKEIEKNLYLVPLEVGQTIRLNNIFFDTGLATLREESLVELNNLKKLLLENSNMKIVVSGHTDNVGSDANNMKLSADRAQAVVQWLKDNGIVADRLSSKGFGETKPIGDNNTEEGKQENRRVEFTIVEE